jgi:uncharacterized membrane protein
VWYQKHHTFQGDSAVKETQRLDVNQRSQILDTVLEWITNADFEMTVNVVTQVNLHHAAAAVVFINGDANKMIRTHAHA